MSVHNKNLGAAAAPEDHVLFWLVYQSKVHIRQLLVRVLVSTVIIINGSKQSVVQSSIKVEKGLKRSKE